MHAGQKLRLVVLGFSLAATVAVLPGVVGAEPVDHTGPNGAQCHLQGMDGDFVDPENSDTTNNANISLSGGLSGTPALPVAGCDLTAVQPPLPTPTPTPVPPRNAVFVRAGGLSTH